MQVSILLLATLLSVATTAQVTPQATAQNTISIVKPSIEAFETLNIEGFNGQITVEVGGTTTSLTATVPNGKQNLFQATNKNGDLSISYNEPYTEGKDWESSGKVVVVIKTPSLKALKNSTNSQVTISGLNGDRFDLTEKGNSSVVLGGEVRFFKLNLSGNGNIDAAGLATKFTEMKVSGNGNITMNSLGYMLDKTGNSRIRNVNKNAAMGANDGVENSNKEAVLKPKASKNVRFSIKNNSLLPRSFTLISYRPDEQGNGTTGFMLAPSGSKSYAFPVGTRLFLADQKQVDIVMSGASIRNGEPFLVVKATDQGQVFDANK